MPRPRNAVPQPRNHKGRAVLDVYENGTRRTRTLGAWGSPEAEAEYKAFLAAFATGELDRPTGPDISVNEVFLPFIKHAEQTYRRPDGTPTHEVDEYKLVSKLVRELYGHTPARDFGPLALKSVRTVMIGREWCRSLVNQRVNRVRRVFKWAAGEELVAFEVYQRLTAVAGLQKGRSGVRESEPVGPVAEDVVDATLRHLNRHVRGLIEFQRLTGCRPGEACAIRRADIDTGGAVWLYKPAHHKTAWRGKTRTIAIGPKAQSLLKEFFTPDLNAYLFSPARAVEELHARRAKNRKTPRYPSHLKRNATVRVKNPKRAPADVYDVSSYGHAINRACDKAFPLPGTLAPHKKDNGKMESRRAWWARLDGAQRTAVKEWQKARHWHPNQLRHTFATEVRRAHGLEAAQVLLGHSRADVTQVYAERNEALAADVAAKIG